MGGGETGKDSVRISVERGVDVTPRYVSSVSERGCHANSPPKQLITFLLFT